MRFAGAPPGLVPGIGPKTAARLTALGLTTLAAVGAAPEQMLVERFGPNLGRELSRRARFEHDGEVGAARKVVSESRERTFDEDIRDPVALRERVVAVGEQLRVLQTAEDWQAPPTSAAGARSESRSVSTTSPPSLAPRRSTRPPATSGG